MREIEARYQALVAAAAPIVWTTRPDGSADDMPLWRAYTGQSVDEVAGWGWLDAVHPADRERTARIWARAVAAEDLYETEYRIRRRDGAYRAFLVRGVPVLDAKGQIREWVGACTDVTARREAEEALRASEERVGAVVAHAPIVLFAVDRDGVFTLSAGQALASSGLRPGQHVGQSYFDLYGHMPESVAALKRALAGEAATTVNEYNGLVFETRWTPTRGVDGSVTGAIGVSTDITERRRYELRTREALEALLAMAEALVQRGDDEGAQRGAEIEAVARRLAVLARSVMGSQRLSITVLDEEGGAPRPLTVLGTTAEEERQWRAGQPGAALRDYLDAAQRERLLSEDVLVLDAADTPERRLPYGIRSLLLVMMRVGRRAVGVLAVDHGGLDHVYTPDDIALARAVAKLAALVVEHERLVREREEARANAAALREANRRMETFLGLASHEMRTPLTTITGNIQLARRRLRQLQARDDLPAPAHREAREVGRHLERSDGGLRRLGGLVADILDATRIQEGRLRMRRRPCDLAEIVRDIVDEQRGFAPLRTIRLEGADGAVPVEADAERIGQVLTNYLSNALKYSAQDRPVVVGLDVGDALARVWVRDEGPGIAREEQGRIWELFYRAERTPYLHGSSVGLGMGLHISGVIVEQHGGQVGVESAPGAGATFWFTLPRVQGA